MATHEQNEVQAPQHEAHVAGLDVENVHFILSAMPRGGFSGGVAFSEYGFALGVVTRSLTANHSSIETGFMAVLGVQSIYGCLADNHLLPDVQAGGWDGFWNSTVLSFHDPKLATGRSTVIAATLEIFDDRRRYALTIICSHDQVALDSAISAANQVLDDYERTRIDVRPGMTRIDITPRGQRTAEDVRAAGQAMSRTLIGAGYAPSNHAASENPLMPAEEAGDA